MAVCLPSACGTALWNDPVPNLTQAEKVLGHQIELAVGQVRSIDHPDFEPSMASEALWTPLNMLEKGDAGVFFLEAFDPERIPVLFVAGIQGSPRNFRYMIESLDRSRFQVWVFNYPSGFRIKNIAALLHITLSQIDRKYQFDALFITAHSLGGLVAESYIKSAFPEGSRVKLLVTFSTPWMGHSLAEAGARNPIVNVPSWRDLSPRSEFLLALREPGPDSFHHPPHYVFFGFRRKDTLFTTLSSDGVISVASQLPPWILNRADRNWGYDTTHTGILSHELVLERYHALLNFTADCLQHTLAGRSRRLNRRTQTRQQYLHANRSKGELRLACSPEDCTTGSLTE